MWPEGRTGSDTGFTPTELLLAAIAGCTAIDVDILTSRRAEPDSFAVRADADKVRDAHGSRLTSIVVTFRSRFPAARTATRLGPSCRMRSPNRMTGYARFIWTILAAICPLLGVAFGGKWQEIFAAIWRGSRAGWT
jgi:hypothetical protein